MRKSWGGVPKWELVEWSSWKVEHLYAVSTRPLQKPQGAGHPADTNVYALNASTGVKLWSYATGNAVGSSPAVAMGVVYVGSADSNVYALNAKTGVKLWKYKTSDEVDSSPAVANGVVYVGGYKNVYALNAKTGAKLWSYTTGNQEYSSPVVSNGVVYIGLYGGNVCAFGLK
jgi:outer membrane protein assembly factor BamB